LCVGGLRTSRQGAGRGAAARWQGSPAHRMQSVFGKGGNAAC